MDVGRLGRWGPGESALLARTLHINCNLGVVFAARVPHVVQIDGVIHGSRMHPIDPLDIYICDMKCDTWIVISCTVGEVISSPSADAPPLAAPEHSMSFLRSAIRRTRQSSKPSDVSPVDRGIIYTSL